MTNREIRFKVKNIIRKPPDDVSVQAPSEKPYNCYSLVWTCRVSVCVRLHICEHIGCVYATAAQNEKKKSFFVYNCFCTKTQLVLFTNDVIEFELNQKSKVRQLVCMK